MSSGMRRLVKCEDSQINDPRQDLGVSVARAG